MQLQRLALLTVRQQTHKHAFTLDREHKSWRGFQRREVDRGGVVGAHGRRRPQRGDRWVRRNVGRCPGFSSRPLRRRDRRALLMNRRSNRADRSGESVPRGCGDGPDPDRDLPPHIACSPRVRGWTRSGVVGRADDICVSRVLRGWTGHPCGPGRACCIVPRACGDGPSPSEFGAALRACSPRVRGWTVWSCRCSRCTIAFPARAGTFS